MAKLKFHYLYGPVYSWRLGQSLGIDPLSQPRKICTFDCVYCQLGRARPEAGRRRVCVPTRLILEELRRITPGVKIDYITFSGNGEPTLAKNLGALIRGAKKIRPEPVAVITNATLLHRPDVRQELMAADFVMAKLDAATSGLWQRVNHPVQGTRWQSIVSGIKSFRRRYRGVLALQMMFVPGNLADAARLAQLAREIKADEVQLNTPLRPSEATPLSRGQMQQLKKTIFQGLPVITVYERRKTPVRPISRNDTLKRRGKRLA